MQIILVSYLELMNAIASSGEFTVTMGQIGPNNSSSIRMSDSVTSTGYFTQFFN